MLATPKLSRATPRNWAARVSRAVLVANQPGSPFVTAMPTAVTRRSQASSVFWATRISAGRLRSAASNSASAASDGASPIQNSPVDTSTSATPSAAARAVRGEQEVVGRAFEELGVGDRAGRDHAHDFSPHEFPTLRGRLHLLAHRDLLARADEPRDVPIGGMMRDAGHGNGALALLPGGQRDLEQAGSDVRIIEEQLVEVAEPEEQQVVRVAALQLPVLPHHRREVGRRVPHESSERSAAESRS